ncbi:hypothetical protein GW17_00014178 [Ensete ventricosum]|nr:hypothetical protein GW17_00014178 [Ensete ventricosum]
MGSTRSCSARTIEDRLRSDPTLPLVPSMDQSVVLPRIATNKQTPDRSQTDGSFPPRQAEPRKSHIPCGERTRAHAAAKRSASIERKNHPPKDSREPSYCHVGRSPQALTQYFQRARVKGGGGRKRKIASPLYRPTDRSQFKSLRERTGKEETKRGRSNWIAPDRSALRAPRGQLNSFPSSPFPPQLSPQPSNSRTNLNDLKSQIAKRLGAERAQRYFIYLNGLLSQKMSKLEFNKLCLPTLGRENLHLHNLLIRSILENACRAKVPPPANQEKGVQKPVVDVLKRSPRIDDGFNALRTLISSMPSSSNGRPARDYTGHLGPNGRAETASCPFVAPYDEIVRGENGDSIPSESRRLQHQQVGPAERQAKRPRLDKPSLHYQGSVHGKGLVEVATVDNMDRLDHLDSCRGPLRAPLGIPFCSASIGGARSRPLSTASASSGGFGSSYGRGELFHTEILKKRMEQITEAQGLGDVSMDCAKLLNNSLDAYLKLLIRSCVELVGARIGNGLTKRPVSRLQLYRNSIVDSFVGNNIKMQIVGGLSEGTHELKNSCLISMQDFRVAMELNPQQLGEDWPLLLEKISIRSCKE